MKYLSTSNVLDPSIQQPFTAPSLIYIEDAYKEAINAAISPFILNPNTVTLLSGCSYSTSGGTYTIASGSTYYNGEVYLVPAAVVTPATGETVVGVLSITDPLGQIIFSDGIARTVFYDRQIVLSAGTSGSGISNTTGSDFLNWDTARPLYKTYTPTITSYAVDNTTLVTGTSATMEAYWQFDNDKLFIDIRFLSITIAATAAYIQISLPISLSGYNARGNSLCNYYDGVSTYDIVKANIFQASNGSGSGLQISKLDGTAFGAVAAATANMSIVISKRRNGL